MRATPLYLLCILLPPGAAAAGCEAPDAARFRVVHDTFGEIGRHEMAFRCEGRDLIVETEARLEVGVIGVTAYTRTAHYREVWRDDRLLAFDGETVEDGETKEVRATRKGDGMTIEGPAGRFDAPLTIVPDNPWNVDVVERPMLFDVSSGELVRVDVRFAGTEPIVLGDRTVEADHYVRTGDREHELWYDKDGAWLRWHLDQTTGDVTFVRLPSSETGGDPWSGDR